MIPDTLQRALQELLRHGMALERSPFTSHLIRSKYGSLLHEQAGRAFLDGKPDFVNSGVALARALFIELLFHQSVEAFERALNQLREYLASAEVLRRCEGALGIMDIAFRLNMDFYDGNAIGCGELLHACADALVPLLFSENASEQCAVCWALAWIGGVAPWTPPTIPNVIERLFTLWLSSSNREIGEMAAWALSSLPLLPREAEPLRSSSTVAKFRAMARRSYPEGRLQSKRCGSGRCLLPLLSMEGCGTRRSCEEVF